MVTSGFVEWMSGGKYSVRLRAVRDFPKLEDELDIDISSLLGPLFYAWIFNILFPAFLNMIVYVLNVVTPPESEDVIVAFVEDISPNAERSYVLAGSQRFHIAAGDKVLSKIFSAFASKAKELGVIEWGIANGTLEDALVAVSLAS